MLENPAIFDCFFCPVDFVWFLCSKRSGNIINRKIRHFYTKAISNFFFQFRKKYIIFLRSKKCSTIFFVRNWKSLKSHKEIPYTHRRESGNNTFQNMYKIFTGLENAFAEPGWVWKPHKSKDRISTSKQLYPFFVREKSITIFWNRILMISVRIY